MSRFTRPRFATRAFWTDRFWVDRATWTARAYDLQQRLAITRTEATALVALAGLLLLGSGVRAWQAQQIPYDDAFYAETDATFAALSEAAPRSVAMLPGDGDAGDEAVGDDRRRGAPAAAAPDTTHTAHEPSTQASAEATADDAPQPSPPPRSTRAAAGPVRMNINTASARLLDRLPGIGPALAGRIIEHRATHGPFQRPEDLVGVRGIGPKTFAKMAPFVFVEEAAGQAVAANTEGR